MLDVRPFEGILYRVPDLSRVLAPPYDVIGPEYREQLLARDPHNVVRVILSPTPDAAGYASAGTTYRRWLSEGVLVRDASPALYLLEQRFELDGSPLVRRGIMARFRAADPVERVVLPHEQTRRSAREDRYRLRLATRANFSPIFMMFRDPGGFQAIVERIAARPPDVGVTDDGGVAHRLWRIAEPPAIAELTRLLGGVRAYIADGHHRHATALRLRDELGPEAAWAFGYFTPIDAPALKVLPYHRMLERGPALAEARARLEPELRFREAASARAAAQEVAGSRARYAFALAGPGGPALVAEGSESALPSALAGAASCVRVLDAFFVHQVVLPRLGVADEAVRYVHSFEEAEAALVAGRCPLALLMRGTPVAQIVDVADAGESMPAKSTYFHPKLPSGLVIHPLLI